MKKLLFSVVLIVSTFTFTFAQDDNSNNYVRNDYSKWSITPKGGLTYYRITPTDGYKEDISWGAGLSIERLYTPLLGIGLDFTYNTFDRKSVKGAVMEPTLFGSANLSNLFLKNRKGPKINIYAKAGFGVGFTNNDLPGGVDNEINPSFMGAIHPEYDLSKSFAIGLEVTARYYAKETIGGLGSKDRFDDAMTAMLTLRYNIGSSNHLRHVTLEEFYPAIPPKTFVQELKTTMIQGDSYDDSKLINRLDNLDRQNQNIQNRLTRLENDLRNLKEQEKGSKVNASFENIEFDFDSSKLTDESVKVLNQILSILKEVATWSSFKVNGYTDNIGSEAYNLKLSQARVETVKEYLVANGISADVITTEGHGEADPIADNATKEGRERNRRVTFEFVK